MTFVDSVASSSTHGHIGTPKIVVPGVTLIPYWYGHGSLFVYDGREDHWLEIHSISQKIVNKWVRILSPAPSQPWVNTCHPPDGEF